MLVPGKEGAIVCAPESKREREMRPETFSLLNGGKSPSSDGVIVTDRSLKSMAMMMSYVCICHL